MSTAAGWASHAEGKSTEASGKYSHAEGEGTVAPKDNVHVQGKYNTYTYGDYPYAHVVGNGTDTNNRSNAHTLDWNGNAWYAGSITAKDLIIEGTDGANTITSLLATIDELLAEISSLEARVEALENKEILIDENGIISL